MSGIVGLLIVVMPWPFWRDAIDGDLHYVTPIGISGYALSVACVGLVLYGLISRPGPKAASWLFFPSLVLVVLPILKWLLISVAGLELFHNRMGLGQEIAGFIPNLVIDGILAVASIGLFVVLIVCRRAERDQ